ncbi:hypothetical protein [Prosthecobacter vanneervenii]|uniref:Uncharacterized protein n=1 Tax=Prosthecobacter vanneervenii TaxID=48466 RepID=A0A7W8DN22_9BACT|nr:hypothetical protein [Prosthecobacter vanneervenii]MBB5035660.1 hypothetical protein [Prosthecobacter vanneervenii]
MRRRCDNAHVLHPPTACLSLLAFLTFGASAVSAQPVTLRTDKVAVMINDWFAKGTATGLQAITYENRDGQHSPLHTDQYPQLQVFPARAGDTGAATQVRSVPLLGNCSMASAATQLGCLPRIYMMDPAGNRFLAQQYLSNNLFIYPEHQDYDIGGNGAGGGGYGDLLPLNTPCLLISQGSSFTDQPFLRALLSTTAAFPPDTQKLLIEKHLLASTLQSIFRRAYKAVEKPEDYYTGKAHPPVFDGSLIDEEKMVNIAHEMTPEKIPPLVLLRVIEETKIEQGKNFFELPNPHPWQLSDSPVSIARILRGNEAEHGMLISFDKTFNLMKAPLKMRAALLQGDPRFVQLESQPGGDVMRLRVRWAPPITTATGIRSHRIDIGIFADNGGSVSAPAIISFYMLPSEMHFYDEKGRVSEIQYQTHNPDFGLPATDTDTRWVKILLAFSLRDTNLRSRLLDQILSDAERSGLQRQYLKLKPKLDALTSLENDATRKDLAAQLRKMLQESIREALKTPVAEKSDLTVRATIEKVIDAIGNFHQLYLSSKRELDALAAASPKSTAVADVRAELHHLITQGVLLEQASGQVDTVSSPDKLSLGERYMLRGLNLTLVSQVLFADVLERSTAPAYVNPRLTTPKVWRDVYRYDPESGELQGWIRYADSRISNFDAEGRFMPEGPKGKAVPVLYLMNANGQLTWRPQPEPKPVSPPSK